jgi:prepilin-type N-terminal cleavage/methylation domain-containing protein
MQKSLGFSLIEMIVVLALLGVAGSFLGSILWQSTKGQKKVSANLDFNIKMAEVFNVLQNSSYCNSATNGVFRQASGATLNPAKLTNENTPATNDVNWIGYQVGSGGTAQNIKVLQEGDVLENTYTISEITFQRLKDTAGDVVAASGNATTGKTTHQVELVVTATPTSGSGFPITKSFKTTLITDTPSASPTNDVVGCGISGERSTGGRIELQTKIYSYTGPITSSGLPYTCTAGICASGTFSIFRKNPDEMCQEEGYQYAAGTCYIANVPRPVGGSAVGAMFSNSTITSPERLWAITCMWGSSALSPADSITCVR